MNEVTEGGLEDIGSAGAKASAPVPEAALKSARALLPCAGAFTMERVSPEWGLGLFLLVLLRWAPPAPAMPLVPACGDHGRKRIK